MENGKKNSKEEMDFLNDYPLLKKAGQEKSHFEVPALYFEEFPNKIETLLLSKKGIDFTVPEGYFETLRYRVNVLTLQEKPGNLPLPEEEYFNELPRQLQERVAGINKKEKVFIPVWQWGGLSVAVIIVLAMIIVKPFENEIKINHSKVEFAQLSKQEIYQAAVAENFDVDFLMDELMDPVASENKESIKPNTEKTDNHETVSDYLLEENIDLNTIVNEL
jgi:hypothetical protein